MGATSFDEWEALHQGATRLLPPIVAGDSREVPLLREILGKFAVGVANGGGGRANELSILRATVVDALLARLESVGESDRSLRLVLLDLLAESRDERVMACLLANLDVVDDRLAPTTLFGHRPSARGLAQFGTRAVPLIIARIVQEPSDDLLWVLSGLLEAACGGPSGAAGAARHAGERDLTEEGQRRLRRVLEHLSQSAGN